MEEKKLKQNTPAFHARHDGAVDLCRGNVHVGTFFVVVFVKIEFRRGHMSGEVGLAFASFVAGGCEGRHHEAGSAYANNFFHNFKTLWVNEF